MPFLSKPHRYFLQNRKTNKQTRKFIWNCIINQIDKTIFTKKEKARGLTLPDFKIFYKATVNKQYLTKTDI